MSPWVATFLAAVLLVSPWLLMPRRPAGEIRGLVRILWALNAFYCVFWHRLEVMSRDPLPSKGPAILISNHTCCIDHMLLQAATRRLLGFVIAQELYEFWLFRPFCRIGGCIPVRRDGNDVAAMRAALRALQGGRIFPIFPEGRIRPTSGRELGEAKPGAAFIALRAGVPVIPAYICGTPETNKVARSYLTPSHARLYFGPPIDLSDLTAEGRVERDAFEEVTRRLMAAIAALRDQAMAGRPGAREGRRRFATGMPMIETDLTAVLTQYPSAARPSSPPEPLGNAGGLSGSRLWRYRSGLGELVARAWPPDGPSRPALQQIHDWLSEAGPVGFVPVPVRGLDGRTFRERGGRLWEVSPWMPGTADPHLFRSPGHVAAAFAALASFHLRLARHATTGPSPGLHARLRELEALIGGGFSRLEGVIRSNPTGPLGALALAWIAAARAEAPAVFEALKGAVGTAVTRQPCVRDVRPDHVLFQGVRVTGLVDFGAMGIDTVAADLARLASEGPGRDPALRAAGFDAYDAIRPIGPRESALIDVFERSAALLGAGHWVRWHYLEGRRFDDPSAVRRGLEKGLGRLRPDLDPLNAIRS